MNTRKVTAFLVLGMGITLFLSHVYTPHLSVAPFLGSPAAAQMSTSRLIIVKSLPNTSDSSETPWHRYEITLPAVSIPPDMHVVFLVDGKGEETVSQSSKAWSQPLPFRYRLDDDDDIRVKYILEAQGFPVKKNLVTYKFAAGAYSTVGYNTSIRFRREPGGQQEEFGASSPMSVAFGEKIVLDNRILSDADFKGDFDKVFTLAQRLQPEFAPKTPPGLVHHLVVYLMFQPHEGPPAKNDNSYTQIIPPVKHFQ